MIGVGRRGGSGLYELDITPETKTIPDVTTYLASRSTVPLNVWHQRLAHISYKSIKKMGAENLVDELSLSQSDMAISNPCNGCMSGKIKRLPFPVGCERATHIGQLVHSDVRGPMEVPTTSGARYLILFTDYFSNRRAVYVLREKSEAAENFKKFAADTRIETGHLICTLHADNGGEFTSNSFKMWLSEKAITLETSAAYTPEQNGVAESANGIIMKATRSLLHAKHLPLELWGKATACAVYTLNRIPNSVAPATPFEI